MSKNSIIVVVLVIVALGAAVFYFGANKSTAPTTSAPATSQGRVVVGITDASTPLTGVTSIMMTVDKVEVENATQGWVTVSSGTKQYDLLALKNSGAVALLADIIIPAGTYDQIRLTISKVTVTASGVTSEAKLPSGTLKIVGRVVVAEGKTASVVLDFKADKSLHKTGNGKFILAPVVHLQTKSDTSVNEQSDNTLKIDGGKTEDDKNIGMDEHGDTKDNFELDANVKIEIDSEDVIHVMGQSEGGDQNKGETSRSPESVMVSIKNFFFTPSTLAVKKGTKVTWVNNDSVAHTITSDSGNLLSSGTLAPGQSFSFTFTNSGTANYHCSIHPAMKGQVVVKQD